MNAPQPIRAHVEWETTLAGWLEIRVLSYAHAPGRYWLACEAVREPLTSLAAATLDGARAEAVLAVWRHIELAREGLSTLTEAL